MPALGRGRALTEREMYIVIAAIAMGFDKTEDDWNKIFELSRNGALTNAQKLSTSQAISWRSRKPVKDFHAKQVEHFAKIKADIEKNAIIGFLRNKNQEEIAHIWQSVNACKENISQIPKEVGEAITPTPEIDFRDRESFLNFLNKEANRINDQKTRLDVLKMLSDLLRMKEAESGREGEIQRFYTPLSCRDCELYRIKAAKINAENDSIF